MWNAVFAIPIVAIVFGITSDIIKKISNNRLKAKQLEFLLREKELEAGVAPGTYSRMKGSRRTKGYSFQESTGFQEFKGSGTHQSRQDLEKGIEDLLKRVENLDTVLAEKNAAEKKNGHKTDLH
ncbi:hypothetical protein [Parasphaerochaeta coccoides]|uniref:Uncharacterized protein n=1 Tax=Parasphaerochaeta coccoides (strain ATCC BAA-1237 / DSM 17374 / SPN1) TaxID=760011 RepID=F4GJV2_PARC1|nr:hypothetical protein [Parasphaerochaeta coccoides]AEC01377.1 hypothetical protein Spico_0139 [Parasphaerochaeta coccoides DSM 17374]